MATRLDEAEAELRTASQKIEAAIKAKQTDLDVLRLRQRSLRQTADTLRARALRHQVAVPDEIDTASAKLASDVSLEDVGTRER